MYWDNLYSHAIQGEQAFESFHRPQMTGSRGLGGHEGTADSVTERDREQPTHVLVRMMTVKGEWCLASGALDVSTVLVVSSKILFA